MSKSKDIVLNSLDYLDRNNQKYKPFFEKIKYYSLVFNYGDMERNQIIFFDKEKKEIFKSNYEIIGIYNNKPTFWTWAWSITSFNKNEVYLSRKILNYGLDLDPNPENFFLKTELVTSRFRISDITQLDIHVSIASYISKMPLIYKFYFYPPYKKTEDDIVPIKKQIDPEKEYQIYYLYLIDFDKLNI